MELTHLAPLMELPELFSTEDFARAYAQDGFRVFPIKANGKTPAVDDWDERATTDLQQIRAWWSGNSRLNVGVATGGKFAVVDADVPKKPGDADGRPSLDMLKMLHMPPSFGVATPSGGEHLYVEVEHEVRNGVKHSKDYPGIDTRGMGGYVVGAGSVVDGKLYRPVGIGGMARAVDELHEKVFAKPHQTNITDKHTPAVNTELIDHEAFVKDAIYYLENLAPEAVEGAGGNETTYRVACRVKGYGISEDRAAELMADHWNLSKAFPPWDFDELSMVVGNAYNYSQKPLGADTAAADFGLDEITLAPDPDLAAAIEESKPENRPEQSAIDTATGKKVLTPSGDLYDWLTDQAASIQKPLIEGLMDLNTTNMIYGDSSIGKSFFTLDLCLHVASGMDWQERKTQHGQVIYVAGEGKQGISKRVAMWAQENKPTRPPLLDIQTEACDLHGSSTDAEAIIALAKQLEKRNGEPVRMIVFDTLATMSGAADENQAKDANIVGANLRLIRQRTGAAVVVVHHTGKHGTTARGSSAWRGAVETEIHLEKDSQDAEQKRKAGDPSRPWVNVWPSKQRDMDDGGGAFPLVRYMLRQAEFDEANPVSAAFVRRHRELEMLPPTSVVLDYIDGTQGWHVVDAANEMEVIHIENEDTQTMPILEDIDKDDIRTPREVAQWALYTCTPQRHQMIDQKTAIAEALNVAAEHHVITDEQELKTIFRTLVEEGLIRCTSRGMLKQTDTVVPQEKRFFKETS